MKTAVIHARIDPDTKNEAETILRRLGISPTDAIRIFYAQIILQNGLPSGVKIPNDLTAENRPEIKLKQENIPEILRYSIPMAEKWGGGDDIIRDDIEENFSNAERQEIKKQLTGPTSVMRQIERRVYVQFKYWPLV